METTIEGKFEKIEKEVLDTQDKDYFLNYLTEARQLIDDIKYFEAHINRTRISKRFSLEVLISHKGVIMDWFVKELFDKNTLCIIKEDYFVERLKIYDITYAIFDKIHYHDQDQLLKINNKQILWLNDATAILNTMAEGDSALYTVSRNDEIFETKVVVKKLIQFGGLSFALLGFIWLIVGLIVIKSKESGKTQFNFFSIGIVLVL